MPKITKKPTVPLTAVHLVWSPTGDHEVHLSDGRKLIVRTLVHIGWDSKRKDATHFMLNVGAGSPQPIANCVPPKARMTWIKKNLKAAKGKA